MTLPIVIGGIIGIGIVIYVIYASLIAKKNKVREALSGVDVQFQKRADLVPNMLKAASRYMAHEKQLFEDIVNLRNAAGTSYDKNNPTEVASHIAAETRLQDKLATFQARLEAYPDLKSDGTMIAAMNAMADAEANISAARRFYNAAVNALNNAVETWPMSTIARRMSLTTMPFFEAEETARKPIDVNDHL